MGGVLSGGPTGLSSGTFPLVTQFVVVLPQFGDKLSSLQLYLRVGGQVLRRRLFSDHSIGLDVQIPVDPENKNLFFTAPSIIKGSKIHNNPMLTEYATDAEEV